MATENGIIYEIVTLGNTAKVTAIDEATGTEACIVAPKNTPTVSLKMAAKRKLTYVLNKNKQSS